MLAGGSDDATDGAGVAGGADEDASLALPVSKAATRRSLLMIVGRVDNG
jgi:hypothetical protein